METPGSHKMSVVLTLPQRAYLRDEAKRLGITVGELLRRIIDAHREERERKAA